MTTKTPSEQADEIVEMFAEIINLRDFDGPHWEKELDICSTDCAILHVTGIIEVLWEIDEAVGKGSISILPQINHYQQILTILKEKL